ncbi:MAG: cytochrome b N-terminal domain-containing protein [Asticcacaulis sp.]
MIATAFMGYVLPYGQMSYYGAVVITNLIGAIPVVGPSILTWLQGGFAVDQPTLNRFFSLHYLLPFVIAGVVVLHIWALHGRRPEQPDWRRDIKSKEDHPAVHAVRDRQGRFRHRAVPDRVLLASCSSRPTPWATSTTT